MNPLIDRMVRAARLDASLYEDVEADRGATGQAMLVVALSSVAAGIGIRAGFTGLIVGTLGALLAWYVWAYLTYWIGSRVLHEPGTHADHGELLRTLGFASSPGVLRILGIVPGLSGIVFLVTGVWMFVAAVIAIRQALDYRSTGRAIAVGVLGWIIQMLVLALVFRMLG